MPDTICRSSVPTRSFSTSSRSALGCGSAASTSAVRSSTFRKSSIVIMGPEANVLQPRRRMLAGRWEEGCDGRRGTCRRLPADALDLPLRVRGARVLLLGVRPHLRVHGSVRRLGDGAGAEAGGTPRSAEGAVHV